MADRRGNLMTWRRTPPSPLGAWLIHDEAAEKAMMAYLSGKASWRSTWNRIGQRARSEPDTTNVLYRELFLSVQELADDCVNRDSVRVQQFGPATRILPSLDETDPGLFQVIVNRVEKHEALKAYVDAALHDNLAAGTWIDVVFDVDPDLKSLILPIDLIYVLRDLVERRRST